MLNTEGRPLCCRENLEDLDKLTSKLKQKLVMPAEVGQHSSTNLSEATFTVSEPRRYSPDDSMQTDAKGVSSHIQVLGTKHASHLVWRNSDDC